MYMGTRQSLKPLKPQSQDSTSLSLTSLLHSGLWDLATERARNHPEECTSTFQTSTTHGSYTHTETQERQQQQQQQQRQQQQLPPALALACRLAAPLSCIKAILEACPRIVRSGGGLARGTPLHEAISNSRVTLDVISLLIQMDEDISTYPEKYPIRNIWNPIGTRMTTSMRTKTSTTASSSSSSSSSSTARRNYNNGVNIRNSERAALAQDVDGQTPLHLLVRRYFSFHPQDEIQEMIQTLKQLITSCPEACAIPDRRDFEETPLVLALKANMYAHYDTAVAAAAAATSTSVAMMKTSSIISSSSFPDATSSSTTTTTTAAALQANTSGGESFALTSLLEEKIHTVTNLMLTIHPASASNSAPNLDYTPLHSAVYHGRCKEIIKNLLEANESSTLYANEGRLETPLHFAAMRGESELVISALVNTTKENSPKNEYGKTPCLGRMAVTMLDENGLTPLHWLWIRMLKESESICFSATMIKNLQLQQENLQLQQVLRQKLKRSGDGATGTTTKSTDGNDEMEQEQNQIQVQFDAIIHPSSPQLPFFNVSKQPIIFDKSYFNTMKELDPPLDYRQMRHLPSNYATIAPQFTDAIIAILKILLVKNQLHNHECRLEDGNGDNDSRVNSNTAYYDDNKMSKPEAMVLLFWRKVEYLIEAAAYSLSDQKIRNRRSSETTAQGTRQQQATEHTKKRAFQSTKKDTSNEKQHKFYLVHAAAASICCPPSILYIALSFRANQLSIMDHDGNLPIHHAAMRPTHWWQLSSAPQYHHMMRHEYDNSYMNLHIRGHRRSETQGNDNDLVNTSEDEDPNEDQDGAKASIVTFQNANSTMVEESSLPLILLHSPPQASRTYNYNHRLPLHLAIDNVIHSCATVMFANTSPSSSSNNYRSSSSPSNSSSSSAAATIYQCWQRRQSLDPLLFLRPLLKAFPEALERRDGETKLFPFMQATAKATSVLRIVMNNRRRANEKASVRTMNDTANSQTQTSSSSSTSPMYPMLMSRRLPQTINQDNQMESQFTLYALNVSYCLLRENPMLVSVGIPSSTIDSKEKNTNMDHHNVNVNPDSIYELEEDRATKRTKTNDDCGDKC